MTHMTNYAHDRLALYTFESVINFIQCWTNLQLSTMPALPLAKKYFDLYPEEREPVWGVSLLCHKSKTRRLKLLLKLRWILLSKYILHKLGRFDVTCS